MRCPESDRTVCCGDEPLNPRGRMREGGSIWEATCRISGWMETNRPFLFVVLAYLALTFAFNWGQTAGTLAPRAGLPFDYELVVGFGEIAGFIAAAVVLVRRPDVFAPSLACMLPYGLMAVGCLLLGVGLGVVPLRVGAEFLLGCGYAGALVPILCMLSLVSVQKMLLAVALAFLSNLLFCPFMLELSRMSGALLAVACAGVACLGYLLFCVRQPQASVLLSKPAYWPSWDIVLFALAIPFIFSFCKGFISEEVMPVSLKMGWAIPATVVIVGLTVFCKSFSISTLFLITMPMTVAGTLCAAFAYFDPLVTKTVLSAALACTYFVAYTAVRLESAEQDRNPGVAYAIVTAAIVGSCKIGKEVYGLIPAGLVGGVTIGLVTLLIVLYGVIIVRLGYGKAGLATALSRMTKGRDVLRVAQLRGLSKRETTIFLLIIEEKTTAQIAEELFITTAAVRTHTSHIYAKFGVHSREELLHSVNESR